LSAWKRDKNTKEPPPKKPDPPRAVRYVVQDTSVEALAPLLLANPRELLVAREELSGWIGSFDRYAGGKGGADAALEALVKAGHGAWVPTPPGRRGQPTRRFVLSTVSTVYGLW
jgi:hypothetical protein